MIWWISQKCWEGKSLDRVDISRVLLPLCSTTLLVQHLGRRGSLRGSREADLKGLVGSQWWDWTKKHEISRLVGGDLNLWCSPWKIGWNVIVIEL